MLVINAENVNDAWYEGIKLIFNEGVVQPTRNGSARVIQEPVATVYRSPTQRVIFDPVRDANPIFHHMESLWMLAGRDDATWLDQFVSDFSKRFAEDGGRMHGAYGKRWRNWFVKDFETIGSSKIDETEFTETRITHLDQLDEAVRLLREDPESRQVVIGMWDPSADLGVPGLADRPCNTHIYLRTDRTFSVDTTDGLYSEFGRYLDMTVCCRSNDAVYGAYGANAVHMSTMQEYLAARIGVSVGTYTQMSNNLHMYDWSELRVSIESARDTARDLYRTEKYPGARQLVDDPLTFDGELKQFLADPAADNLQKMNNSHFYAVAQPMWRANEFRKAKDWKEALQYAESIEAPDWRRATVEWLNRRAK